MEQILLSNSLPKETSTAIMMLYKNTKVKVHSLDGDTDYFNIVGVVLQRDALAPYLFIICLDYTLRTSIDIMKDNSFKLTKERSKRYPAQTIMDMDYADDIALQKKFTCPSQNPATLSGMSNWWHRPPCQLQTRWNTYALIKEATSPH